MLQTAVESSNIKWVGWEGGDLFVRFVGDRTYMFANVTIETYNALVEAPSVGKFFHSDIKPNYVATLVPNAVVHA